ncbi:hypothetical protein evm_006300 [Chilo suppressalis]|nr:hypothetical protein evm_006300 [Chilo suppressalis]
MDVLPIIFFICTFVAVMAQDAAENDTDTTLVTTTKPVVTTALPTNCTTARALEGVCTARTSCDHGTPVIDLSLYKPSWYRSPCASEEVCCPFDSLVALESDPGAGAGEETTDDENFD